MCYWRLRLQNNESGTCPMRSTFSVVLFPLDEKRAVWLRPVSKRLSHKGRHEAANTFDWRRLLLFTSSVWFGFRKFCIKIAKRQQTVFLFRSIFHFHIFPSELFHAHPPCVSYRIYHECKTTNMAPHFSLQKKSFDSKVNQVLFSFLVCRWRESESTMGLCRMEVVEENLEEEESTGMICRKQR